MLLTKTIVVKWNPTTREHYEKLGYKYTKHNDSFIIPVEHLPEGSNEYIEYKCDYCHGIFRTRYHRYLSQKDNRLIQKDSCKECYRKFKVVEEVDFKQKLGILKENDIGYFKFHENRIKALDNFLKQGNTLKNIPNNKEAKNLYDIFYKYNDNIYKIAEDLGYKIDNIVSNLPSGYFDDFNNIKSRISLFIESNNRFPKIKEIEDVLNINLKYIQKYGGLNEIKKSMNYKSEKDLIDKRGDINKSELELYFANYLIENNLGDKYLREQYPFPRSEGRYRSDFTLYVDDDRFLQKEIHIEVWGKYRDDYRDKRSKQYQETRKKKEKLYEKYKDNILLISLDCEIFRDLNRRNELIEQKLIPYMNLNYLTKIEKPHKVTS